MMKTLFRRVKLAIRFIKALFIPKANILLNILDNLKTLDYIIENKSSVVRFGDGEVLAMCGKGIDYQNTSEELAGRMQEIINTPSTEKLVICLPDVFHNLGRYRVPVRLWWRAHLQEYEFFYNQLNPSHWYGSTFLSRPYIDLKKARKAATARPVFEKLKQLWQDEDLLIVEGYYSRSGTGNDLFENANSVQRIICPPKNAYSSYRKILDCVKQYADGKLVLLMLGPAAKLLAYDLAMEGYRAIDLGHIDSEYEWFKMGVNKKVQLQGKHTAESNFDINVSKTTDSRYYSQIICDISGVKE